MPVTVTRAWALDKLASALWSAAEREANRLARPTHIRALSRLIVIGAAGVCELQRWSAETRP